MKRFLAACSLLSGIIAGAAAPELVEVGLPGNPGKLLPFGEFGNNAYERGALPYVYRMGKTEVTNKEYCEFLNAYNGEWKKYCFDSRMKIRQSADGKFSVVPGAEDKPLAFVNKIGAALYCNYISKADVYKIAIEKVQNAPVVSGIRDLYSSKENTVYYIPDMHEFYKAAFYEGNGKYRTINRANRKDASHFGLLNTATGVSEWMENPYVEATFALGAADNHQPSETLNAITLIDQNTSDLRVRPYIGFRVAATGSVAVAPVMNDNDNFFGPGSKTANLRIRSTEDRAGYPVEYALVDYFGNVLESKKLSLDLKKGVNDVALSLPEYDGGFTYRVKLANGTDVKINVAVIREPMKKIADGNFGLNSTAFRYERGFCQAPFPFHRIAESGATWIRCGSSNPEYAYDIFSRAKAQGLNILGTLASMRGQGEFIAPEQKLVDKWEKYNVAPELAGYAEKYYQVVARCKGLVDTWQLGNEPQHHWKGVTPEDYSAFAKNIARAVRAGDPKAKVQLSDIGCVGRPIIAMRAAEGMDSICIHSYSNFNESYWGLVGWIRRANGLLKAAGVGHIPMWMTETNICTYRHRYLIDANLENTLHYQAMFVPKTMVAYLAMGIAKVFVYTAIDPTMDSREETFGMLDRNNRPKSAYSTFRITAKLLRDAKFTGFIRGCSFGIGKISAFGFTDSDGKKIVAAWRNDKYANNSFATPYDQLIGKPEIFKVKGSGTGKMVQLNGKITPITARNGYFELPVDEYPCFLTGDIDFEFEKISTERHLAKMVFPEAVVQILPDIQDGSSGLQLMNYYDLTAQPGKKTTIKVRVHNLTDKEQTGEVALIVPETWKSFSWPVKPERVPVKVKPHNFATASFEVTPSGDFVTESQLVIKAIFKYGDNRSAVDSTRIKPGPALKASNWSTPFRGWKLTQAQDKYSMLLYYKGEHHPYGRITMKAPISLFSSLDDLNKNVKVRFSSTEAISELLLIMRDYGSEEHLVRQKLPAPMKGGIVNIDCRNLKKTLSDKLDDRANLITYGGDNNRRADFPMTLLALAFIPEKPSHSISSGGIAIHEVEVEKIASDAVIPVQILQPVDHKALKITGKSGGKKSAAKAKPYNTEPLRKYGKAFSLAAKDWKTPTAGWKLGNSGSSLNLTWGKDHKQSIAITTAKPVLFMNSDAELDKDLFVSFKADFRVRAIAGLFKDAQGEEFMVRILFDNLPKQENVALDCQDMLRKGKFISYGKNKDGIIQYPLRWIGLTVTPFKEDAKKDSGSMDIAKVEFFSAEKEPAVKPAAPVKKAEVRKPAPARTAAGKVVDLEAKRWFTPFKGWSVSNPAAGELEVAWSGEHRNATAIVARNAMLTANESSELNFKLQLDFKATCKMRGFTLIFRDAGKEEFLVQQLLNYTKEGKVVIDANRLFRKGEWVSYGGDKNKTLNFPVRLVGLQITPNAPDAKADSGSIVISNVEIVK